VDFDYFKLLTAPSAVAESRQLVVNPRPES